MPVDQTLNWELADGSIIELSQFWKQLRYSQLKNIEVLSDMNWSSDVRRFSLNCRFQHIRISLTQYINSFRRYHPHLTWAFRDEVQRSDLNMLFRYLFPWYQILSDVFRNHRCKQIDIVNMLHVIFLHDQKDHLLNDIIVRAAKWSAVALVIQSCFRYLVFIWFNDCTSVISLERLQQRCVEQLVDMTAPRVMRALVEVVRLIHQERPFERKEEHIVDLLEQQVAQEIFEGIHGDKSAWWHWLETESEGDGSAKKVMQCRHWLLRFVLYGERGGSVFRVAKELKIVSEHDVVYVSTSKNLKADFCSEQRSIFRDSWANLSGVCRSLWEVKEYSQDRINRKRRRRCLMRWLSKCWSGAIF